MAVEECDGLVTLLDALFLCRYRYYYISLYDTARTLQDVLKDRCARQRCAFQRIATACCNGKDNGVITSCGTFATGYWFYGSVTSFSYLLSIPLSDVLASGLSLGLALWLLLVSYNGKSDLIVCFLLPVTGLITPHIRGFTIRLPVVQDGTVVELNAFLATFVVRMYFRNSASSTFSQVWKGNASTFSADAAVPRLCSFP